MANENLKKKSKLIEISHEDSRAAAAAAAFIMDHSVDRTLTQLSSSMFL